VSTWSRVPEVLWRRSGGRVILLSPSADRPAVVAGTGAAVWELLERPRLVDELVDELAARYGSDRASVERDLSSFLDELQARQVLRCEATSDA
jgi:hypothetical protein